MTVTAHQIAVAKDTGLSNVEAIAAAANKTKCPFYLALAMIERESNGKNIYGHDKGGALAGFPLEVNEGNYRVFKWMIDSGYTSNGVGPAQLTYKGFFDAMEGRGQKPWVAAESTTYGVQLLFGYYKQARADGLGIHDSIKKAGTRYNGAAAYGDGLLKGALKWKERVGNADYT
jgi:hypothetical protein